MFKLHCRQPNKIFHLLCILQWHLIYESWTGSQINSTIYPFAYTTLLFSIFHFCTILYAIKKARTWRKSILQNKNTCFCEQINCNININLQDIVTKQTTCWLSSRHIIISVSRLKSLPSLSYLSRDRKRSRMDHTLRRISRLFLEILSQMDTLL